MAALIPLLLLLTLFNGCLCQDSNPNNSTLPEERGLIITTLEVENGNHAIIRHLGAMPGYENFTVLVPGIAVTSDGPTHVTNLDIDFKNKEFYMYDYHYSSILVGTGYTKELEAFRITLAYLHFGVSKGTIQIAFDWLSRTIYWVDSLFRWILAVPGQQWKAGYDFYKIIVDDHLDLPDGITLDPLKGYLFWSDNGRHPKIERSDLQGRNRHTIVNSKYLYSPMAMDADIYGQRIYWLDTITEALLSSTYDGDDVRVIHRLSDTILFDLAVYRDVVYISDIKRGHLITLNKTTGHMESTIVTLTDETIYGITVYEKRNQPEKNRDYCAEKKCEQICISEENGASCICAEGYKLNSTGNCEESLSDFHKAVVLGNYTHICLMDIRGLAYHAYAPVCKYTVIDTPPESSTTQTLTSTSTPTTAPRPAPTASPDDMIKLIDVDSGGRMVFIATNNNMIYKRAIDLPIENDARELLRQANGNISGLAFDYQYSANLYWTEIDTGNIMFVNVETKYSNRVIIANSAPLMKPRNLIVLPTIRQLAWVAGNDGDVSIQTMTLDGRNLKTVINGLPDIKALVYEDETRLFYFISNGTIKQMALDGSGLIIATESDQTAYLLLHYNNYLTWIYTSPLYGIVYRTKDYSTDTTGAHAILDGSSPYIGIKILDVKPNLPQSASPCAFLNGGCEQLCITKYTADVMEKQCECSVGYKLDTDKSSCRSDVVTDDFILFTEWTSAALHQINLRTNEINAVINQENDFYLGVYFDPNSKKIIWSEYQKTTIFSSNLDGSDKKVIGDLGNSYPYRMDKDLTTGNIYYTTTPHSDPHVGVLTPSGDNFWLKVDVTHEDIWDIVVHPGKGWMFYTVVHSLSYIARSNMDGTNAIKVVFGDHIRYPDGLAIDFIHDQLYWSDALYDTIQRCNLDGSDCVTIVNGTGSWKIQRIRDIVTDGTNLYYAADNKDHVDRISLTSPYNRTIIGQNPGLGQIDTLAYYSSSNRNIQPVNEACKARKGLGNCSTICLPTATGRTCACKPGGQLKQDGRTCSDIYQCSAVISQEVNTASGKELIDIVLDRACLRHLNDECKYRCPEHFVPTGNTKLSCTSAGWDRESVKLCREVSCPVDSVPNGRIKEGCKHRVGEICMYECDGGYTNVTEATICNTNMRWTPYRSCTTVTVSVIDKQSSGISVAGTASGIAVCVFVIIVLVIVIVYLLRRSGNKQASKYAASAEFHKGQDGTVAIENPGYAPSEAGSVRSVRKKEDTPYSTVSRAGQGGNEPLPEVAQIESTRDTTVLTYDSWIKARQTEAGAN
ncbi:prolow-density lipoprotein receptor-related protein 1-like isoform X2 [Ruditapes philippinarum]|uniref:prolow-density lipoprotein receptor-related protein 1-like isoform X2 n=1 Tax=Ruditapes philippinarum TaxID=129788 RepID=UPI00295A8622|nr:prolow-density lipoprotein receptor-related protein 1-like isoform X2 [Ruditapes philippinarum]